MSNKPLSMVAIMLALALALLFAASATRAADERKQRMLITGQVEVIEEDLHGDPKILELVSDELGRFRVATDRKGDELLKHAGKWVSVFGEVEMANGIRTVHVDGFRLLQVQTGLPGLQSGTALAY